MKKVLVLCTGNSCRSQMAHGYLEQLQKGKTHIYSAGIETHGLNPGAVAIMAEDYIDISQHTSNQVDEYQGIAWDYIITVCDYAKENYPLLLQKMLAVFTTTFSTLQRLVAQKKRNMLPF